MGGPPREDDGWMDWMHHRSVCLSPFAQSSPILMLVTRRSLLPAGRDLLAILFLDEPAVHVPALPRLIVIVRHVRVLKSVRGMCN